MDTFDYQRTSVPARMPAARAVSVPAPRFETPTAEQAASPISIRSVFRAARRYWWLILALWAVGSAGLGAAIYLKVRPQFRAMSLLQVNPNMMDLYGGGHSNGNGPDYMQTHVELIKSPTVLSAAIEDEKISKLQRIKFAGDAIQELTKVVQVSVVSNTKLIEVSMMSPSNAEAADIVNAVVTAFMAANKTWSNRSVTDQIAKLKNHYDELQGEIRRIEGDIKTATARGAKLLPERVVRQNNLDDPARADKAPEVSFDVAHYHKMANDCMTTKTELVMAEARLAAARAAAEAANREVAVIGAMPPSSALINQRVNSDPEMVALLQKQQAAMKKVQRAAAGARVPQSDPAVMRASQEYQTLENEIIALRLRKRQMFEVDLATNPSDNAMTPDKEVRKIEAEVQQLIVKKNALESQLSTLKIEGNQQQTDQVEVQFLVDDRRARENSADQIRKRLDQLNYDRIDSERIFKLSDARPEGRPISDKRIQYLAMTPFGVLAVVLGLAVLLEIRSGRVADPEFLSNRMRHEVFSIAPLPSVRPRLGSDNSKAEQRLARFVQSLDHLRVALCEGGTSGEGRCVMITSATGGEGKTTLSAHLAARCANAGTSTLLIDADLRRASLGRLLDVPAGTGLGDVLAGQAELDANLVTIQAGGFHFLSAGTPGIDPTRVLKSNRLAELIGQLRQMYDLIIIDTPPVLPVADALILGRWADGAVMAARYDASRVPLVERANRQIVAAGIPVLGVVVNGVRGQDQAYGNYAYNYSYPGRQETVDQVIEAS